METGAFTETNWTTETPRGSENKWLSVDMKYCPVACLQIISHFYYLHISWPCFCYRMTNTSNGTLVKCGLILETSERWISVYHFEILLPAWFMARGWHTHTASAVTQSHTFSGWTQGGVAHSLLIGKVVDMLVFLRGRWAVEAIFLFTVFLRIFTQAPKGNSSISASIDFLYVQDPN